MQNLQTLKLISLTCGYIVTLMALTFLFSWHVGFHEPLQLPPATWPIPYSASASILLLGIAIISIFYGRWPIPNFCGALIVLIAFSRLVEVILNLPMGINEWIVTHLPNTPTNITQWSLAGPLSYGVVGIILTVWPKTERFPLLNNVILFLLVAVTFSTILGMLVAVLPVKSGIGWKDTIPVHFYSSFALFIAGVGLIVARFYFEILAGIKYIRWLPITVTLFSLLVTILIGLAINEGGDDTIREFVSDDFRKEILYSTLIGGFLISFALGMLIYLWQLAQQRIISTEDSQKQVKKITDDLLYTLETADIGTWNWKLSDNTIDCNEVTFRIFGFKLGVMPTYDIFMKTIHLEDREKLERAIKFTLDTGAPFSQTYRIVLDDGSIHYVMSRGRNHVDDTGKTTEMTGICWDITNIKKSQQFLEILDRISIALNESMTTAEAVIKIRHILYRVFGWEVMILWTLDQKKTDTFDCLEISTFHELTIPEFENYTRENRLSKNETVPGNLLSTHKSIWYTDYTKSVLSKRANVVERAGLKGFLAFPMFAGASLIGLVELFKTAPFVDEVDQPMLNLFTSIGVYLGQFIHRRTSDEAQAQLASIVTHANGAIYTCDLNGTIKTWNAGAERIYGWTEKEVVGKDIDMLYPTDKRDSYAGVQTKVKSGQSIENFETQRLTKDGRVIWVDNSYSPIRNDAGTVTSTCTFTHEITKQKIALTELQQSEEKFRAFVEATEEWIWEIDANFRVVYTNPTVYQMIGFTPEEVHGKELFIIIPEKYRQKVKSEILNYMKEKRGWNERLYKARHANGTIRYLESNSVPVFDDKNNVIGFRGADRDVTDRMLIERSKNEFISTVSHELRTPLTSIHGALGLISNMKDLPPKVQELTAVAYRNSERLSQIIDDILDLERSKLGKLELRTKPIVLADVVRESIVTMKQAAEKNHISIVEGTLLPDADVFADPNRLIQVMTNLLSNAIKFSHPGGKIYVSMEKIGSDARVSVRDQGIGISKDFQPRVFERFSQANSTDSRITGGTGLGLNICKTIIEQFGGRIGFTSIPGEGSTFYFDLFILPKG